MALVDETKKYAFYAMLVILIIFGGFAVCGGAGRTVTVNFVVSGDPLPGPVPAQLRGGIDDPIFSAVFRVSGQVQVFDGVPEGNYDVYPSPPTGCRGSDVEVEVDDDDDTVTLRVTSVAVDAEERETVVDGGEEAQPVVDEEEEAEPVVDEEAGPTLSSSDAPEPAPLDLTGSWSFEKTVIDSDGTYCDGDNGTTFPYIFDITQTGATISVETPLDASPFPGTFEGETVEFAGDFEDGDGRTDSVFALTLDASGNTMEGDESWTYFEKEVARCENGLSKLTATRIGS